MSKCNNLNFILKGFPKSTQKIIEMMKTIFELKKITCKSSISIHFNNDVLKAFSFSYFVQMKEFVLYYIINFNYELIQIVHNL